MLNPIKKVGVVFVALLFSFGYAGVAFASTGAIFTTDAACSGTNVNLFPSKDAVYLDGGPQHLGSAGLPDGDYYAKVTVPNGDLLGYTLTNSVHVVNGAFVACYKLSDILVYPDGITPGYDTTTNGGGEYKVWISAVPTFDGGTDKTDNFKVKGSTTGGGGDPSGSVVGSKWEDLNADGNWDGGELGLAGWTVTLTDGTYTAATTTDSSGDYSFDNVPVGTYSVCETAQGGWYASYPDTDINNNCHPNVVVSENLTTFGINFGNYRYATISGHKYEDVNGDGVVTGDPTIAGWNVAITGPVSWAPQTNGTGAYSVTTAPGTYTICEEARTGWAQTFPGAGFACGNGTEGYQVTVVSGDNSSDNDFGNFRLAALSGLKFYDANANGIKDGSESNIVGWQVTLKKPDNSTLSTVTDANGNFFFGGLLPGTYTVCEGKSVTGNWTQSWPTSGNLCGNGTFGYSVTVTTSGQGLTPDYSKSFGNYCSVASGGLTIGFWSNKNGQNLENAADFTLLTGLNLRSANGTSKDFTGTLAQNKTAFSSWLLNANATNMAYMLSAQLAAMELNVAHGKVNGNAFYVPAGQTVNQLMAAANTSLGTNPFTVASGAVRTYQEQLKSWLDQLNNGAGVLSGTACTFSF